MYKSFSYILFFIVEILEVDDLLTSVGVVEFFAIDLAVTSQAHPISSWKLSECAMGTSA